MPFTPESFTNNSSRNAGTRYSKDDWLTKYDYGV